MTKFTVKINGPCDPETLIEMISGCAECYYDKSDIQVEISESACKQHIDDFINGMRVASQKNSFQDDKRKFENCKLHDNCKILSSQGACDPFCGGY